MKDGKTSLSKGVIPLLVVVALAVTLSTGDVIKKDPLMPNRYEVRDKYGIIKGRVVKDTLMHDQYLIYDRNGKRMKTIKQDSLNKGEWRVQ